MTNPKKHLALAIATVLVSAVIGTAHNTTALFAGVTTTVILTVEDNDGKNMGQFIGYVTGTDVSDIVKNHKDAKGFKTAKELLKATSTFLGRIKQDDSILLTDSTSSLGAMFRDMQNFSIKIPTTSCISRVVNVPEVVAANANGATVSQYGRENRINVTGIEKNPIQFSEAMPQVYQRLLTQVTDEQSTGHSTARSA